MLKLCLVVSSCDSLLSPKAQDGFRVVDIRKILTTYFIISQKVFLKTLTYYNAQHFDRKCVKFGLSDGNLVAISEFWRPSFSTHARASSAVLIIYL